MMYPTKLHVSAISALEVVHVREETCSHTVLLHSNATIWQCRRENTVSAGTFAFRKLQRSDRLLVDSCKFVSAILDETENSEHDDGYSIVSPAILLETLLDIHLLLGNIATGLSIPMVPKFSTVKPVGPTTAALPLLFKRLKLNGSNVHLSEDCRSLLRLVSFVSKSDSKVGMLYDVRIFEEHGRPWTK